VGRQEAVADKAVLVNFSTGKDVLNAYWGYLSNGGLVLRDQSGLSEGDAVALEVFIESLQQRYRLRGQVVRRPNLDAPTRNHAVIAFDPGEPHDLLLSAAWADTDKVPARKHRRHASQSAVSIRSADSTLDGRLINVSRGGCCVRVRTTSPHRIGEGAAISLVLDGLEVAGKVCWARAADFGLEFSPAEGEAVNEFLGRVL
jgi:Tfp pilus assembly protein PilZ